MMESIHPEAQRHIDEQAFALLAKFKLYESVTASQPRFPSEKIPAATLFDEDFIGEPIEKITDTYGKVVAKFYYDGPKRVGLDEEDYTYLPKIVSSLQKVSVIRNKLSETFLEDHTFLWCRARLRDGYSGTLTEYLADQLSNVVRPRTAWIPIASFEVQQEFNVGNAIIRPIAAQFLKGLQEQLEEKVPTRDTEHVRRYFDKLRQQMQGHAAVVIETEAEPIRAFELAMEKAEDVIGILRLFSQAAFDPELLCPCSPLGTEHVPVARALFVADGKFGGARTQARTRSMSHWRLDAEEIQELKKAGLDDTAALLWLEKPSAFQNAVIESHLRYSRSTMVDNLGDRLVYMLTALESLYLKDGSEQIGQNLAERLAFSTAHTAEERETIIKNVKGIYKMRSDYLHHGVLISERNEIAKFMMTAYNALEIARLNCAKVTTVSEFCSAIDHYKLGGGRSGK